MDNILENRRNNLVKLINKYYKSINEFCVKNDLDYSALHRYTSGNMKIGNISLKKFEKIFNLKHGDLDKFDEPRQIVEFPVYNCLASYTSVENLLQHSPDTFKNMNRDEFSNDELENNKIIGIACNNDAMSPNIKQGWIVFINLNDNIISDGETYALIMNNKIIFRDIYYSPDKGYLILKPLNFKFNESLVKEEQVSIIGKPIYVIGRFKI